jgi:hypothetical protein
MSSISDADATSLPVEATGFCRPNISPAGKRRRRRIGYLASAVSVMLIGLFLAVRTPWYVRLLVGLPAALAAVALLQVRRNTCIARAAEGTFEHDDFSKTAAPPDEVAASRRVAAGIRRDSALIGLLGAALAAASVLIADAF